MEQSKLFADEPERGSAECRNKRETHPAATPRLVEARRDQIELRTFDFDTLIPKSHRARAIWSLLEELDLSLFYEEIKAVEGEPGRPPIDPKVLLGVWIYATADGIGSARKVEELCKHHAAYKWLMGTIGVTYHTLSTFRGSNLKALDELTTQILGVLLNAGLVRLKRVAQDGTRIRASAGSSSFRSEQGLEKCLEAARRQVEAVKQAGDDLSANKREQAARERAARERLQRVEQAKEALKQVQRDRAASKKGANDPTRPARGSTTDPDARKMRMADGGSRPGYNVQFATDTESGVILGVAVTQDRTDFASAVPMMEQIAKRMGKRPEELLVDTGFTSEKAVTELDAMDVMVYGALPVRKGKPDPYEPRPGDPEAMRKLKERMRSSEGKAIYKERAPTAERPNADMKAWRSLDEIRVRGLNKVTSVAVLNVIAVNFLRWIDFIN